MSSANGISCFKILSRLHQLSRQTVLEMISGKRDLMSHGKGEKAVEKTVVNIEILFIMKQLVIATKKSYPTLLKLLIPNRHFRCFRRSIHSQNFINICQ